MAFVIVLIALAVQYFLRLYGASYQVRWVEPAFVFLQRRLGVLTKGHGLFGVFLFVAPALIVVSLLFTFVYHLLGYGGHLLLSLVLLWYVLDVRFLHEESAVSHSIDRLFLFAYQQCFAALFFYFIFGPIGLACYAIVTELFEYLQTQEEAYPDLLRYAGLVLAILDWIPVRLLGLSFALVGHFTAVFKSWLQALGQGVEQDQAYVVDWGRAALSIDATGAAGEMMKKEVVAFLMRALYVWLVAMALVSLGLWFG